jgi:hypothetical protein
MKKNLATLVEDKGCRKNVILKKLDFFVNFSCSRKPKRATLRLFTSCFTTVYEQQTLRRVMAVHHWKARKALFAHARSTPVVALRGTAAMHGNLLGRGIPESFLSLNHLI